MAWTSSKVFTNFVVDLVTQQVDFDLASSPGATAQDTFKVALYNDTITPNNTVASASSCYNTGQWVNAGEVFQAGGWASGGLEILNKSITTDTSVASAAKVVFDADDLNSSSNNVSLTNATGCLIYDTSRSNRGICYNWFGGSNTVYQGTFTIVWSTSGIISFVT